ncbi:hypothetical protein LLE87_31320, partial [Paenibacillus polymyxa]|nr:hypothetical protein [Paenibacillus polymyxa]
MANILQSLALPWRRLANPYTRYRYAAWIHCVRVGLALLASIAWVIRLTHPLFTVLDHAISARDLILLLGGLFLIWKAIKEIHETIEGSE